MLHIQMAACRDWDFHKYIPNVISFLPHYHHSDMHTSVSKLALFCIHMWQWEQHTDLRGEDRQRLRGSGGCSLQSPQAEPEAPRADKDRGVLRALRHWENKKPLGEQCLCTWVFVGQRYCRGRMKPYLQSSSSLVCYWLNYCCLCMYSLPSEYKIKKKKIYMSI